MDFVVWLIVGVVSGWVASLIMYADPRRGLATNVLLGVIGALFGGLALSPLIGSAHIHENGFSPFSFIASMAGAAAVLTGVNVSRQVQTRGSDQQVREDHTSPG